MYKVYLLFGLILLIFGCTQPLQGTQYVCPDGKTVADKTLCSGTQSADAQVKYVCSDRKTTVTDIALCPASGAQAITLTIEEELSACSGMPELPQGSLEEICITGLAAKHKDTTLCKKLSIDQRKNCYALVAQVAEDSSMCDDAGTQKDQCYEQYAREAKDSLACGKISEISQRDSCYTNLAGVLADATLCEKIKTVGQKDSCYWQIASRLGDTSYCNKITNTTQVQNCLQNMPQGMSKPVLQK